MRFLDKSKSSEIYSFKKRETLTSPPFFNLIVHDCTPLFFFNTFDLVDILCWGILFIYLLCSKSLFALPRCWISIKILLPSQSHSIPFQIFLISILIRDLMCSTYTRDEVLNAVHSLLFRNPHIIKMLLEFLIFLYVPIHSMLESSTIIIYYKLKSTILIYAIIKNKLIF